ncbi:MAG: CCA tRNA nucleotidyltransferase, partial [Planctomycetes bacterium]|nr:CCA tRNA nucleotidyltransferase [Planctomycetota bacterium]
VRFVSRLDTDAKRRDFTVNGLFYDLATGEVIDHIGGLHDLERRLLRTIGDADQRFAEDHLRLLRLVRFAARTGFAIAAETAAAARAAAAGLSRLAPEAVYRELTDAFTSAGRGTALRLLVDLGVAAVVLPEVAAMDGVTQPPEYHPEGDVLTHVGLVLDAVPAGDPILAWCAVLHDIGKPATWRQGDDRIRFDGHDQLSADMAREVLQRFRAGRELIENVVDVCREHIRFAALPQMRPRRRERWLRSPNFGHHLAFHRADCIGSHGNLQIHAYASRELDLLPAVFEPLVTGRDVLALGVEPGPMVGELLRRVHAAADESPVAMGRAEALELLGDFAARRRQGPDRNAR